MAVKANLVVDQGSDFQKTVTLKNVYGTVFDLTGYTGYAQMRKSYGSTTATNFSVSITSAAGGQLSLGLSHTVTANITAGRYVYDVEVEKNSARKRVLEGILTVTPGVTQ